MADEKNVAQKNDTDAAKLSDKENALQLIRTNLQKGNIPQKIKLIMAGGTMPSGDEVPLDILMRLAGDEDEEVQHQARQLLAGYSNERFLEMLHNPDVDPAMLNAIIDRFATDERRIREIFFDPNISLVAKKTCLEQLPHIFANFLSRQILHFAGGQIIYDSIKNRPGDKHFVIEKLLEFESNRDQGEAKARELTDVQKVLLKNFNPKKVTPETRAIFAKGTTPKGEKLPAEIILQLLVDEDKEIRSQAAMTLMDFDTSEIAQVLTGDNVNQHVLEAMAHYAHDPQIIRAICISPHVTDETIAYIVEKDFPQALEAVFRHLNTYHHFAIFRQVLVEYPECANYVVSQFFSQSPTALDLGEWIQKARLEKQVNLLARELESIKEMEQHTFSMAQILHRLPPENVASIGDIIHGKAAGGQKDYDRLFMSLLDINLLRDVWSDETFGKVMAHLKKIKSTALLKTWALLMPYQELSDKLATLVYAFWRLAQKFAAVKSEEKVYITVVELFHFLWNLLKAVQKSHPTFTFFDLKTLFLGSRSLHLSSEEEEQVIEYLLEVGFHSLANGDFQLDLTTYLSEDELKALARKETAPEKKELTPEEVEKVKKEIKKLSTKQKIALVKQSPIEVLRVLLKEPEPEVVMEVLKSDLVTHREALVLALQKVTPPQVLAKIAENAEWMRKYPIKIAMVNNPNTPGDVSMSFVTDLLQQDLLRVIQSTEVPGAVRKKAENQFRNRVSELSVDERARMAERASVELVDIFIDDPSDRVQIAALRSPGLRESHLMRILKRKYTPGEVLDEIASNPVWINSYSILLAVVNHPNLPKATGNKLIKSLSTYDLKALSRNREVSSVLQEQALRLYLQKGGR